MRAATVQGLWQQQATPARLLDFWQKTPQKAPKLQARLTEPLHKHLFALWDVLKHSPWHFPASSVACRLKQLISAV